MDNTNRQDEFIRSITTLCEAKCNNLKASFCLCWFPLPKLVSSGSLKVTLGVLSGACVCQCVMSTLRSGNRFRFIWAKNVATSCIGTHTVCDLVAAGDFPLTHLRTLTAPIRPILGRLIDSPYAFTNLICHVSVARTGCGCGRILHSISSICVLPYKISIYQNISKIISIIKVRFDAWPTCLSNVMDPETLEAPQLVRQSV